MKHHTMVVRSATKLKNATPVIFLHWYPTSMLMVSTITWSHIRWPNQNNLFVLFGFLYNSILVSAFSLGLVALIGPTPRVDFNLQVVGLRVEEDE